MTRTPLINRLLDRMYARKLRRKVTVQDGRVLEAWSDMSRCKEALQLRTVVRLMHLGGPASVARYHNARSISRRNRRYRRRATLVVR